MSFNPSQQRAPAATPIGGQWISAAAAKAAAKKAAAAKKGTKAATSKSTNLAAPKLGPARNAAAALAQQDKQAQQLYAQAMGMDPTQRAAFLKKLPPDQLEKLTAILYSSPTSDKDIVAARFAVANEMTKRGLDIKKYGALGGGLSSSKASPAQRAVAAKRVAVKAPVKAAPKAAALAAAQPAPAAPGKRAI